MKFQVNYLVFVKFFLLLQLFSSVDNTLHNVSQKWKPQNLALTMQENVESLIEKIITQIQEYYHKIKTETKCIPDYIMDNLMETLKKSISCVHDNEKAFMNRKIIKQIHLKNFLQCFSEAKKEIKNILESVDPFTNYCPENATEKIYEVNVTTTFTKTFVINIKNGVDIQREKIEFFNDSDKNEIIIPGDKSEYSSDGGRTDMYENSTSEFLEIDKNTESSVFVTKSENSG